jgi:uncharacterized Ntn-hydrolase superfamily protein
MTFTLLVADPGSGLLGAAVASRSLAVGNAVIAVDPAVGAVASQAWTNRELRARMLDALAEGRSPSEVMTLVPQWDDDAERRQVAAMLPTGESDTRTGNGTSAWAGALVRPGLVVLGNLLTGPEVLRAVADSYGAAGSDADAGSVGLLARRMVAAMLAGEHAGGDRRGRQSAAMIVTRARSGRRFPPELDLDLRVDDDAQPLQRLASLVETQLRDERSRPPAGSAFERADGA